MMDLRLPVGTFFLIVGAILAVHGIVSPHPVEGYLLDRDWGGCLVVFGALMTFFGWRGQKADDEYDEAADAKETAAAPKG
jgi:hypothetical protein